MHGQQNTHKKNCAHLSEAYPFLFVTCSPPTGRDFCNFLLFQADKRNNISQTT